MVFGKKILGTLSALTLLFAFTPVNAYTGAPPIR